MHVERKEEVASVYLARPPLLPLWKKESTGMILINLSWLMIYPKGFKLLDAYELPTCWS